MSTQQLALSAVLVTLVFSIALELQAEDFWRVARDPLRIGIGLIPQFWLLPGVTFLAVRAIDLPAPTEAALLLVACCPGGSLSNVVTHHGGGDTAYSVSLSAVAGVLALVLTPLNFAWTMSANPATREWMSALALSPMDIGISLLALLGLPMVAGLWFARRQPRVAARVHKPLARMGLAALGLFIVAGLIRDRALLDEALRAPLVLVVIHNAVGLTLGSVFARLCGVDERTRRAVTIESGMQNSGLALGIIALQFESNLGMVMIASLWGIWHLVSGFTLAYYWRYRDAR